MNKIFRSSLIALLLGSFFFTPVKADYSPVIASDDTVINISEPHLPQDNTNLNVEYSKSGINPSVMTFIAYLKFPLNTLTSPLGAGTIIRLYTLQEPISPFEVSIWGVPDNWDEETLTYNFANANGLMPLTGLNTRLDVSPTTVAPDTYLEFGGPDLLTYLNTQLLAGGDGVASFAIRWDAITSYDFDGVLLYDKEHNPTHPPELVPQAPTAVTMAGFEAHAYPSEPMVALDWSTANEMNILGFNIYRATCPGDVREKLNSSVIFANHSGQMMGDSYRYDDREVTIGRIYTYWVQAVYLSGSGEEVGPQMVTLGDMLYLPLLVGFR